MYGKRASLLTLNPFRTFPKVCRSSHSPQSLKNLALLRDFSTAAERSHFDISSGLNNENYVDYDRNPNGFYGDYKQMGRRQGGDWDTVAPDENFEDGENRNGVCQQKPTRVYGHAGMSEKHQEPVGRNGFLRNSSDSFSAFRKGFQQNFNGRNGNVLSGYTGDGSRSEHQHSPLRQNVNFGWGSTESMKQNLSEFHRRQEDNTTFTNGHHRESHRYDYRQSPVGPSVNFGQGGSKSIQQNFSEFRRGPDGSNWNCKSGYPRESTGYDHPPSLVGQSDDFGNEASVGVQQNVNGSFKRNPLDTGTYGYSGGNAGAAEQNDVSNVVGNTRTSEQNSVHYYSERPGNFQHMQGRPVANNAGRQQQGLGAVSLDINKLDGFSKDGNVEEAVKVLALLERQGIPVDLPRYLALMKACGKKKALEEARAIHQHLIRSIPHLELSSYNRILEMYTACGSMEDAFSVFDSMRRDLMSWDILITGLAKNGHGEAAIDLFTEFKDSGLKPDGQMYIGVFLACKALYDITEGMLHFEGMSKDYGIVPSKEHYVSVVDMLGSTGYLDEALEFIEKMPILSGVEIWETLMNLSRIHGNLELGDRCAELVDLLDPSRLNEQSRAGLIRLEGLDCAPEREKKKLDGLNPLQVRSRVHEYRAGDRSQPDSDFLYTLLRGLKQQMKEAGYIPELKVVLHDVDPESKEEALLGHSERLAVAKGFLTSPARAQMRVIKNLRICVDCHNAMKIISKLVGRELIMRDAKRFHHFKDGVCSCRDYW